MSRIEHKIAELVTQRGGKAFYVGGYVRDRILGIDSSDIDVEVHGIRPDVLFNILKDIGEPVSYGNSFGIYSLRGEKIDIAMPRREHATGRGHRDFDVSVDPFIGIKDAAKRRDFTINALMEDVLTGEIIDPFGGLADLKAGVIRHIDPVSFVEDPLRVLRAAQFASRFGFVVAEDTVELCRSVDIRTLSRERVEEELKKALLKGNRPSVFFEILRQMGHLDFWFSEMQALIGIEQDPKFHPEGDVWTHTMEVIDRAARCRAYVSSAYAFMLLALTHDFGKIDTTEVINGRIHAYGHETLGLPRVEAFLRRITSEADVIKYVLNMVPLHMKPNMVAYSKCSVKTTNHMFDDAVAPKDLIYFAMSDKPVFSGDDPFTGDSGFLFERYDVFIKTMEQPFVTGRDLIDAGLAPGPHFTELLGYAHKLRLAGIGKSSALKQTLAYARTFKQNGGIS